jgi:hypothetical protein
MKWFMILALVAACSSKPKIDDPAQGTPTTEGQAATESNAKPISPYSVKPCYCMKIFEPVCADGVDYGNSCEAECHGSKTWKDGSCSDAPKKK